MCNIDHRRSTVTQTYYLVGVRLTRSEIPTNTDFGRIAGFIAPSAFKSGGFGNYVQSDHLNR